MTYIFSYIFWHQYGTNTNVYSVNLTYIFKIKIMKYFISETVSASAENAKYLLKILYLITNGAIANVLFDLNLHFLLSNILNINISDQCKNTLKDV